MNHSKLDCFAVTDVGRRRSHNEDQFLIADLVKAVRIQSTSLSYDDQTQVAGQSHGKILLVADGMGGHAAGRRASTVAVDETINFIVDRMRWHAFSRLRDDADDLQSFSDDLSKTLKHCQQRIQAEAEWNADNAGMGTTLTIAIVDWPQLHVVHAGDSRCYLYRKQALQQMTRDHNSRDHNSRDHERAELHDRAAPLSEPARQPDARRPTLWNVVGGSSQQLDPHVCHEELCVGDTVLMCTDGLTRHVDDATIEEVLKKQRPARWACEELVKRANLAGGTDNITVAIARFLDPGETPDEVQQAALTQSPQQDRPEQPEQSVAPAEPVSATPLDGLT